MSRPLRIEYEGAWYHVMNRGAARCWIFNNDDQRHYFLGLLSDVYSRFGAEIHAYCLMGNHYHLMIRTPGANLQRVMRHINGVYTQYFNRSEGRDGPLFRGRYKALLVDSGPYWVELSRYIHRNPLDAGIVDTLSAYQWSSYLAYVGAAPQPDWLTTNVILESFESSDPSERYKVFMRGDCDEDIRDFMERKRRPSILGDGAFVASALRKKPPAPNVDRETPELIGYRKVDVEAVMARVCHAFHVDKRTLLTPTRGKGVKSPARRVAMLLCYECCDMTLAAVAEVFSAASYASVGSSLRALRRRMAEDQGLNQRIKLIKQDLTPR